ncbi:MAG: hypothetical protein CMI90_02600 [Pelagibacteraceae bacterium]|nr:hypothetical protein [Pelagibacteraceae bacterium]
MKLNLIKKIFILISFMFLFSGCTTVNETLITSYESLKEEASSVKNYVSEKFNEVKSSVAD